MRTGTGPQDIFEDTESLEMLRHDPDLLAIADAVRATRKRRRRRGSIARSGRVLVVVVAASSIVLLLPWESNTSDLISGAKAAIGTAPVIHVIGRSVLPGQMLTDLSSGHGRPITMTTEVWFDEGRQLERIVSRVGGTVTVDELQTAQGAWTQFGPVYTCSWIAAHPRLATRLRVSCSADGVNRSTPRRIPEARPEFDPALAGFVNGYRSALATGRAKGIGTGVVRGHRVEWLEFTTHGNRRRFVERVAVDLHTLKPLVLESVVHDQAMSRIRITTAESVDSAAADFSRPKLAKLVPSASDVTSEVPVSLGRGQSALGVRLQWPGELVEGRTLKQVTLQRITTGYGAESGIPYERSVGIELVYGSVVKTTETSSILVKESARPQLIYGFDRTAESLLQAGRAIVTTARAVILPPDGARWIGRLRAGSLWVTIEGPDRASVLKTARLLRPAG
ncbi:MAG: hypothetical protein ACYDCH_09015 [Gaiellaceae bacterium]